MNYKLSEQWAVEQANKNNAKQVIIIVATTPTTAFLSMNENIDGVWYQIMSTPAFLGKNGIGKTKEGDDKTPLGVFNFTCAFGTADDPGCDIDYLKLDERWYWSSDSREGYHYNELVNIEDLPDLNKEACEHLCEEIVCYKYALHIDYNKECELGKGSAIFLHCLSARSPFTGGCVAIPEDKMEFVIKNVKKDCVVIIDTLEKLNPELFKKWNMKYDVYQ